MIQLILIWTVGLWFLYRIVMWLKKRRDAIKARGRSWYWAAYLVAFVGVVLDIVYNVVVGTVMFADLPRELTFTARLKRYRRGPLIWRWRLATWFCARLLNPYDPSGDHC
ncbi:MAG TPA: hypothetical protein VNK91_01985 [Burkholderiaceae bacterium]|nr:hypothetical protein [Burkholderiaceae bacterium]